MPRVVEIDTLPLPPLKKPRLQTDTERSLATRVPSVMAQHISSFVFDPYEADRRLHKQRMSKIKVVCEADDWDDYGPRSIIVAVYDDHADRHFSTRLGHYKEYVCDIREWGVYMARGATYGNISIRSKVYHH